MAPQAEVIDVETARERIASNEAGVVDTRDDDEFALGHIPTATHSPDGELPDDFGDRPVIVVCGDGARSEEIARKLSEIGTEAASIDGGMDAWYGEKFPTQPSTDPVEGESGGPPKLPGAGV